MLEILNVENEFDMCVNGKPTYKAKETLYNQQILWTKDIIKAGEYITQDHHYSHAAYGFYQSPYKEALIISYDGAGNDGRFNIYHGINDNINLLDSLNIRSMGNIYILPGYSLRDIKKLTDDGNKKLKSYTLGNQMMNLSNYGNIRKEWIEAFDNLYETGSLEYINLITGKKFITNKEFKPYMQTEGYEGPFAYDIAATNQYVFEERFLNLTEMWRYEYNKLPIIVTGGCALNSKVNERLRKIHNQVFVPYNPDCTGIPMGMLLATIRPEFNSRPIEVK